MAHPGLGAPVLALPAWKTYLNSIAAVLLGLTFLASGGLKILYPFIAKSLFEQLKVPHQVSLPMVLALGTLEISLCAFLIMPRLRRLGAMIAGVLLVIFLLYFAVNYNELRGADCSCFPIIKETVGPLFFIRDLFLVALALLAGWWAQPWRGYRTAGLIMAMAAVFTGVSFGAIVSKQTGLKAPDQITVDSKPYSLETGRNLLFFFDPECMHCVDAAKRMSKLHWNNVQVIAIPTVNPRFANAFLKDTGLQAKVSNDLDLLKQTFKFMNGPYAVALEDGRQKLALDRFDDGEPEGSLKKLGWIQ